MAQLHAACSCLEAAGLFLTPDHAPPGPCLQKEQIRSGLTAVHWGEAQQDREDREDLGEKVHLA